LTLEQLTYGFRIVLGLAVLITTILLVIPVPAVVPDLIGLDKLEHLLVFAALAGLADFAFPRQRFGLNKALPLLAYGIAMELVQWTLPYRSFSVLDMVADGSGLLLYRLLSCHIENFPLLRIRWQNPEQNDS